MYEFLFVRLSEIYAMSSAGTTQTCQSWRARLANSSIWTAVCRKHALNCSDKNKKLFRAFMDHAALYRSHVLAFAIMKPLIDELKSIVQMKAPLLCKTWKRSEWKAAVRDLGHYKSENEERSLSIKCLDIFFHLTMIDDDDGSCGLFGKLKCYSNCLCRICSKIADCLFIIISITDMNFEWDPCPSGISMIQSKHGGPPTYFTNVMIL